MQYKQKTEKVGPHFRMMIREREILRENMLEEELILKVISLVDN